MSNWMLAGEQMENIYLVYFDTLINRKNLVDFEILQNKLYVGPGETTLAFFRVINKTENYLNGFSLYVVNPHEYTPFINKIQCFCYEELMIYPEESIDLPVLFYLDPEIKNSLFSTKEIAIEYILIL
jgi:cytochrome c oxidase assembly protein subunit 11